MTAWSGDFLEQRVVQLHELVRHRSMHPSEENPAQEGQNPVAVNAARNASAAAVLARGTPGQASQAAALEGAPSTPTLKKHSPCASARCQHHHHHKDTTAEEDNEKQRVAEGGERANKSETDKKKRKQSHGEEPLPLRGLAALKQPLPAAKGEAPAEAGGDGGREKSASLHRAGRSKVVLVHCHHGKDRTGLLVAAYKMRFLNFSLAAAWRDNKVRRRDGLLGEELCVPFQERCLQLNQEFVCAGAGHGPF